MIYGTYIHMYMQASWATVHPVRHCIMTYNIYYTYHTYERIHHNQFVSIAQDI